MSTWAVGDVHRHAKHLEVLLSFIPLKANDTLFLLGDLVDRGPDSPGVLRLIGALAQERKVILLHGNN